MRGETEHTKSHKYREKENAPRHTVRFEDTKKTQFHFHTSAAGLDNGRKN